MSLIETLYAVLLFTTLCGTLTLPPNEYTSIRQPGPIQNSSSSTVNELSVQCNGRQFGSDLDAASCLDALSTFDEAGSSTPFVIDRDRIGFFHRALPWKWVSGDGRCVFDIVMKGTAPSETTSGLELARAARRLIFECVGARGGLGGVVSNIGQREIVGIILRSYEPTYIECGTVIRPFGEDRCTYLLHALPADISPTITWGPANQPRVDLKLPYVFNYEYTPHRCRLNIWGANGDQNLMDTMNMYQVWTAGVMIAGMCARFGKSGKYEHLGAHGRLWVLVDEGGPRPDIVIGNQTDLTAGVEKTVDSS